MIATAKLFNTANHNKRLGKLHAELVAMNTQFNGFISGDYEVRFLQDERLTVCVIRNLHKLDERYSGMSVLNPKDEFDAAIGRHKAFKKVLEGIYDYDYRHQTIREGEHINFSGCILIPIIDPKNYLPPVSQLQKDYWKRYGAEE